MIGQIPGSNGVNARIYTLRSGGSAIPNGELADFSVPSDRLMNIRQRATVETVKATSAGG